MARRFHRGGSFPRSQRKGTDWSASAVETAFTTVAASTAALLQVFAPIVGGETAIRIRGLFGWRSDQTASSEDQMGAFGIAVVTEQAATVGITAVPHPNTDAAWDGWMYHHYYASHVDALTSVGVINDSLHRIVIDSKSMRKVSEDDRLVVVIENSAPFGVEVFNSVRILSKLH